MQFSGSKGDMCAEARKLLADGANFDDTLAAYRGEMRCLTGKVGWFAARTIKETGKRGLRYVRWMPFPDTRRRAQTPKSPSGATPAPSRER
jgi:hypothetical protein